MSEASCSFSRRRVARALLEWAAVGAALGGCANYYYGTGSGPTWFGMEPRGSLTVSSRTAVQKLISGVVLPPGEPVVVRPLIDIDPAGTQARFGRVVAEQLAGALVQSGVAVAPMGSERADAEPLTAMQAIDAAMQSRPLAMALVGSYAVSERQVYVSLRLVRPGRTVLAAHDYVVALDDDVRGLLQH